MDRIGVDCRFNEDGSIRIFLIALDQSWIAVEQGRQWVDKLGRHVLIMLSDGSVKEICLLSDTMTWQVSEIIDQGMRLA